MPRMPHSAIQWRWMAHLEGPANVGHPWPVPLRILRHRVNQWIHRPVGRLAGLLLLLAMTSAGVPATQVHAHAGGDRDHDHFAQLVHDEAAHQHDHSTPADPDGDPVLHAHDACLTVSALPPVPMVIPSITGLVAPSVRVSASPPPMAARIPPYRPPIA